jgi:hypothetical protein
MHSGKWKVIKIPGEGNCMLSSLFCAIEKGRYRGTTSNKEKYRLMREFADLSRHLIALGYGQEPEAAHPDPSPEAAPEDGSSSAASDEFELITQETVEVAIAADTPVSGDYINPTRARELANFGEKLKIPELASLAKLYRRDIALIRYENGQYARILLKSNGSVYSNESTGYANQSSLNKEDFASAVEMAGGAIFCTDGHARWAEYHTGTVATR